MIEKHLEHVALIQVVKIVPAFRKQESSLQGHKRLILGLLLPIKYQTNLGPEDGNSLFIRNIGMHP
jgi:hypothetical protein